jgi:hypothetical protein
MPRILEISHASIAHVGGRVVSRAILCRFGVSLSKFLLGFGPLEVQCHVLAFP